MESKVTDVDIIITQVNLLNYNINSLLSIVWYWTVINRHHIEFAVFSILGKLDCHPADSVSNTIFFYLKSFRLQALCEI